MTRIDLTILHFNDVYNVESQTQEPIGGAARFKTALKSFDHLKPLVLFSGDIFAPSIMSTFTGGKQMIPVLNHFGTHCAVFGNHDFDFGLDNLIEMKNQTNFPWLMSNVVDCETGKPLADGEIYHVIKWGDRKIGLIGLVEHEWLDTLSTINPDQVIFSDYIQIAKELSTQLKTTQGCDFVIALTHMRTPNDLRLAEANTGVDLILGGHDHVFESIKVNDTYVIKSGTDFRQLSKISVRFAGSKSEISIEQVDITAKYYEDEELSKELESFTGEVQGKMDEVLAHFSVPLDGRFSSIRTQETNLGNFICDVMLSSLESDVAILNSGTLRSDRLHDAGNFTFRDLRTILPMMDPLLVIVLSGKSLYGALENSVSKYPKLEGRFLQVAGIKFAFDPTKPPGERIDPSFVRIGDEYLDLNKEYKVVTKAYMYEGRDGFNMLKGAKVMVDEELAPDLSIAVQNYFISVKKRKDKKRRSSSHKLPLVSRQLTRRASTIKTPDLSGLTSPSNRRISVASTPDAHTSIIEEEFLHLNLKNIQSGNVSPKISDGILDGHEVHNRLKELEIHQSCHPKRHLTRQITLEEIEVMENFASQLAPQLEGRIQILTEEVRQKLIAEKRLYEEFDSIKEVDETTPKNTPQSTFDES
ncbi:mannosylglucosyl-3-phosphoglycerate phosphatase-like isoform X2 [Artemia franciscana]